MVKMMETLPQMTFVFQKRLKSMSAMGASPPDTTGELPPLTLLREDPLTTLLLLVIFRLLEKNYMALLI